ncbi:MAG: exo-alpha-sialidase, partial [Gemmatimonadaceae bacterium]|nr:exo-alpha-sialidase [Gemmatimonadaceae bacterium]
MSPCPASRFALIAAAALVLHADGMIAPPASLTARTRSASPQLPRPTVSPNVHVSATLPSSPFNEVVIVAHPTDPRRLLACAMLEPGPERSVRSAGWVSTDHGATWSPPLVTTAHWANDPTCAWSSNGTALFVHKVNDGAPTPAGTVNSDFDYLGIERSPDNGRTWRPMVRGPQVNDRPFVAIDASDGAMYVAYNGHLHGEQQRHDNVDFRNTVALMRSDDDGQTFAPPAQRALMDQTETAGSNAGMDAVVVLPDRSIAVLYTHMTLAAPTAGRAAKSTGKPTVARSALMLARSTDSGRTLAPPTLVAEVHSGYNLPHARGITGTMAIDTSTGPHRGRLYVAWADFVTGRGHILLTHSDDAGQNWSAPRFVNDDSTTRLPNGGPDHSMATVAVNRDGVVGVLWYDRRDYPAGDGYLPRFTASTDGGETWGQSVPVSTAANSRASQRTGAYLANGGDTAGLTAAA